MQMVVIQYSVVYPFTADVVVVDFLIFLYTAGDGRIKADIPIGFGIDAPPIVRREVFLLIRAGVLFAAGKMAAPFAGMLLFAVALVDHAEAGHAEGSAVLLNVDGIRDGFRASLGWS